MSTVSVVVPVFNEEENLEILTSRVCDVLQRLGLQAYELVFVDDGSRDRSPQILADLQRQNPHVRVIQFSRNFGHQAALQAGLDECVGDAVVLMDADLQDSPEVIGEFVAHWKNGFDVVYAVRQKRKEGLFKRIGYKTFYRTMKLIANVDVPLDAGDFCLLDRKVVEVLVSLPERNRFLRGLRSWVGFRQTSVQCERQARHAGAPKYTLRQLVNLAISGYVGFSAIPLRIASWLGFCAAFAGAVLIVWAVVSKLIGKPDPVGWASTVSIILFMGGIQLVVLGIIGEYLGRTYDEVRSRPLYIVSRRLGTAARTASRNMTTGTIS